MADAYDTATYYDCCDSEEYSAESPAAALADYYDGWADPTADIAAVLRGRPPLTVTAYVRAAVPARWAQRMAERLAEDVAEDYCEEYGPPDGLEEVQVELLGLALQPALEDWLKEMPVWSCEKVGQRTYSAEEVERLLREERPEWFEAGR